ncbi:MAG TPA: acetyltransferase [Sulfuricurvum sp.]|nr:acetyltransferase [Sulfuricurvum sp.]
MGANEVFIYGASGHGKVVADILQSCGYTLGGWIDDQTIPGVYSWDSFRSAHPNAQIALGIGENHARETVYAKITDAGFHLPTLIHPSAVVSPSATIGAGTVVMPLAVINADARIAQGCILNTASIVEHDCRVEAFVHISPNAALAGNVHIGPNTHIGIGANVIQNISIGANTVIGAGSTVIHDIPSHSIAFGTPATLRKSRKQI